MKNSVVIFISIAVLALIPRILSVQWNSVQHGDIDGDVSASASFLEEQQLIASHDPPSTKLDFFPPDTENLLIAHPPLWSILGAGLSFFLGFEPTLDDAFLSLKILSVVSGMVVILLSFFLGLRLFGRAAGLAIASWVSFSYLMIDFSGNGALYSLHTVMFLAWILIAYSSLQYKAVWFGVVAGLAYLVNHQAMVLAPASVIMLLCTSHRSWMIRLKDVVIVTVVTLVVTSPWLIRNYLIFGDPFFAHAVNATYIFVKAGLSLVEVDGRAIYLPTLAERIDIFRGMLTIWLPNNLYYIARKLFILAPLIFLFFSFAWIDYLFSRDRVRAMLPIIIVLVLHILVSATWPVTKFRYLVPMLPLVFLISIDQIYSLNLSKRFIHVVLGTTTALIIFLSILTYRAISTHTYYYNGAITQDPFHARGEYNYMVKQGLIIE